MLGIAISSRVQTGLYAGFTRAEMLVIFENYKAAAADIGSDLLGASVNGNSFQFGPRKDLSLAEWSRQIQFALSQVDPDFCAPQNSIAVRF